MKIWLPQVPQQGGRLLGVVDGDDDGGAEAEAEGGGGARIVARLCLAGWAFSCGVDR